eukprot:1008222-Prymnesium_polylepis.1
MPFEPLNKAAEKEETQMIASKKSMMMGGNNDAIRALVAEAKEYEEKEEEEGMKPWANCEPPMTKDDKDQIFKEEKENHEERQKQYQCSWHKKVSEQGHAPGVYDGDRVTMHYVGHLRTLDGPVFDSTRERGVPVIINADRGSLAPGLDKGILTCNEGEKCVFTIQPEGGYGNAGYVDSKGVRTVPGDCVLVFEVEIIKVIEQYELWNLDYDTKMRRARGDRTCAAAPDPFPPRPAVCATIPTAPRECARVLRRRAAMRPSIASAATHSFATSTTRWVRAHPKHPHPNTKAEPRTRTGDRTRTRTRIAPIRKAAPAERRGAPSSGRGAAADRLGARQRTEAMRST